MKTAARFTRRRQSSQEPLKLKNRAGPYPSGAVFARMKKTQREKSPLRSDQDSVMPLRKRFRPARQSLPT